MRKRMFCKCGADVTTNVFLRHLLSPKCLLSNEQKNPLILLMKKKEKYKFAWLISEGMNALADSSWYLSVFENKTKIEDWIFVTPRPRNHVRPSTIEKYSKTRKGTDNPACKAKAFNFTKQEVQDEAVRLYQKVKENENIEISFIAKELSKKYPDWRFLFADFSYRKPLFRGDNKMNQLIAYFLNISTEEYVDLKKKEEEFLFNKDNLQANIFCQ
jgi:hypothetical protein